MFTGIVADIGRIAKVRPLSDSAQGGVRLRIKVNQLKLKRLKLGDSVAVQGACMTIIRLEPKAFWVEVSQESLQKTTGLDTLGPVNLEPAMRLKDTVDGHIVSGHVDGLGTVQSFTPCGESRTLVIRVPATLAPYLAYKGSVTLNGVSLTVNQVQDLPSGECDITLNIIAHTLAVTTLQYLAAGQAINIEIDLMARYIARYTERMLTPR